MLIPKLTYQRDRNSYGDAGVNMPGRMKFLIGLWSLSSRDNEVVRATLYFIYHRK